MRVFLTLAYGAVMACQTTRSDLGSRLVNAQLEPVKEDAQVSENKKAFKTRVGNNVSETMQRCSAYRVGDQIMVASDTFGYLLSFPSSENWQFKCDTENPLMAVDRRVQTHGVTLVALERFDTSEITSTDSNGTEQKKARVFLDNWSKTSQNAFRSDTKNADLVMTETMVHAVDDVIVGTRFIRGKKAGKKMIQALGVRFLFDPQSDSWFSLTSVADLSALVDTSIEHQAILMDELRLTLMTAVFDMDAANRVLNNTQVVE